MLGWRQKICLFGITVLATGAASALCLDNRRPGSMDEFLSSAAVVVGHVVQKKDLTESRDDPTGITATIFQVEVRRHLKGAVGQRFLLRSENTSSRFSMEDGRDYLLFLNKDGKEYFVDSCGNSGEMHQARAVLAEIEAAE